MSWPACNLLPERLILKTPRSFTAEFRVGVLIGWFTFMLAPLRGERRGRSFQLCYLTEEEGGSHAFQRRLFQFKVLGLEDYVPDHL